MPVAYLHGAEFIEATPTRPISVVKSAVIFLVGTAPKGALQTLTLVKSEKDIAQFGSELPGFSIPQALSAIQRQGKGWTVLVVNVYNPTSVTAVTAESHVVDIVTNSAKLTYAPISSLVVKNSDATQTLTLGTDYTVDDFGNIKILSYAKLLSNNTISCAYNKADLSGVNAAAIIGGTDGSNVKTGSHLADFAYSLFGFKAKIFIAPLYSQLPTVSARLTLMANKFRGYSITDAPLGTSLAVALAGRTPAGASALPAFFVFEKRTILVYPGVKDTNVDTEVVENRYRSAYIAGVISATDFEEGYWKSPSNRQIIGIVGDELPISFDIMDASTDANALNEKGIMTSAVEGGYRTWGNRNSSFPSETGLDSFINVRRTMDIAEESIGLAMMQYIDRTNITQVGIDLVLDAVNTFLNVLIGRGALLAGSVLKYNPDLNPAEQLATGNVVFTLSATPPPPMERITFETNYDLTLLNQFA